MGTITEIKDEVKQEVKAHVDPNASTLQQLYQYSSTPYPSLLQSALVLATPIISGGPEKTLAAPHGSVGGGGSFLSSAAKVKQIGPSPLSSLLFGSAFALGSWIIYDGDVDSGSGFITAWSSLYLIVNGRGTLKGVLRGKPWPLLLAGVSGVNALIYGRRFFFGSAGISNDDGKRLQ
ncbi:hypothetical protein WICPIJ_009177 [Wickerhamomyces pijperi]|uniref:Altered inheritance of mitochondria protein 19, mitochondrial n=1 Tax=Wickerhamomyces pijperi TaxID=599730 RepID=A0A9P8PQ55_WICPI|nr:hypothetical protein WICPIJ_009177 [Wickerhamomyces pijperi]